MFPKWLKKKISTKGYGFQVGLIALPADFSFQVHCFAYFSSLWMLVGFFTRCYTKVLLRWLYKSSQQSPIRYEPCTLLKFVFWCTDSKDTTGRFLNFGSNGHFCLFWGAILNHNSCHGVDCGYIDVCLNIIFIVVLKSYTFWHWLQLLWDFVWGVCVWVLNWNGSTIRLPPSYANKSFPSEFL